MGIFDVVHCTASQNLSLLIIRFSEKKINAPQIWIFGYCLPKGHETKEKSIEIAGNGF